jgi:Zn-dependent protease with chaperone function
VGSGRRRSLAAIGPVAAYKEPGRALEPEAGIGAEQAVALAVAPVVGAQAAALAVGAVARRRVVAAGRAAAECAGAAAAIAPLGGCLPYFG